MEILFSPPLALPIYIGLVAILAGIGKVLAGSNSATTDTELYSSGEKSFADDDRSVPGYQPFFAVALFFAVLHLGGVVLATGGISNITIVYLLGLMLVLIALILG